MTPLLISFLFGAIFPDHLSQVDVSSMNCFTYQVNAPLWADALSKGRRMCLPAGATLKWKNATEFEYPVGSLLIKEFGAEDGTLIETRLMVMTNEGWKMSGYRWQTPEGIHDAIRVDTTLTTDILVNRGGTMKSQIWSFMSPGQCVMCHRGTLNGVIGFVPEQLSKTQLQAWISQGRLQAHSSGNLDALPQVPRYEDASFSVKQRARAYLHANCAHCHSPIGMMSNLALNLNYFVSDSDMNAIDKRPQISTLGIQGGLIVTKGNPDKSVLMKRINNLGVIRMPYLGSYMVDSQGVGLVRDWIKSL